VSAVFPSDKLFWRRLSSISRRAHSAELRYHRWPRHQLVRCTHCFGVSTFSLCPDSAQLRTALRLPLQFIQFGWRQISCM